MRWCARVTIGLAGAALLSAVIAVAAPVTADPTAPSPLTKDPASLHREPNELGRIPIIMYHEVGGQAEFAGGPRYDIHGLNIASDTFRNQLEAMYRAGWRPVNMRNAASPRINVPRGMIPVVLTFDDARPTQFRYLANGSLDPNCAVGILEAFHARHSDWPRRATFYVLPESQWNGVPFDQDGLERKKIHFLLSRGYEIANHTTSHRGMAPMRPAVVRWELANAVRAIRRLDGRATMDTVALPYGIAPKSLGSMHALLHGRSGGTRFRNRCVLLAGGGPSYAPADVRFDRLRVTRIAPEPGTVERWISDLVPGAAVEPFVSDGSASIVTIPAAVAGELSRAALKGMRIITSPLRRRD